MEDNKIPASEISPQSDTGKKFENFWYYNKWKVIFAVFILIVLAVCLFQCASREKSDVRILYGGALSSSDPQTLEMKKAFNSVMPEGLGKNGVGFTVLEVYSEEYIKNSQAQQSSSDTSASGDTVYATVNASTNSTNYDNFSQLIATGEYSILLIDRWIYDDICGKVGMRGLDEVFGEGVIPADARYDGCSVVFKETDFYLAHQSAFSSIPDDAVLCLCIYSPVKGVLSCNGTSATDADYEKSVEMFRAILNYRIK